MAGFTFKVSGFKFQVSGSAFRDSWFSLFFSGKEKTWKEF
jgi:hypothetical protein